MESKNFEDMLQHSTLHKDEHGSNFVCVTEEEKELCIIYIITSTFSNSVQKN